MSGGVVNSERFLSDVLVIKIISANSFFGMYTFEEGGVK
jgi:hypothetical protein